MFPFGNFNCLGWRFPFALILIFLPVIKFNNSFWLRSLSIRLFLILTKLLWVFFFRFHSGSIMFIIVFGDSYLLLNISARFPCFILILLVFHLRLDLNLSFLQSQCSLPIQLHLGTRNKFIAELLYWLKSFLLSSTMDHILFKLSSLLVKFRCF